MTSLIMLFTYQNDVIYTLCFQYLPLPKKSSPHVSTEIYAPALKRQIFALYIIMIPVLYM